MSVRSVKEATKAEFANHKKEMTAQADALRAAGFVFRGNGPKEFNETFGRWLPRTDFWSKANATTDSERAWHTRQSALASLR